MGIVIKLFSLIGITLLFVICTGIYLDIKSFDQTKGGYEPPYTAVSGKPVDWDSLEWR